MNPTIFNWWLAFFIPFFQHYHNAVLNNRENVYLTLDKSRCLVGDTIWWRALITDNILSKSPSTILYVDLYSARGTLIKSERSLLISDPGLGPGSYATGQVIIPDSLATQTFHIRPSTSYQYSRDSNSCLYYPVAAYNPAKFSRQPGYTLAAPAADSMYGTSKGIVMRCTSFGDSVSCRIRATNQFSDWGRPLNLQIKGDGLPPDSDEVILTLEHPRISLKMGLTDVSGYFSIALLDSRQVLAGQRIYLDPALKDTIECKLDTFSNQPYGINSWEIKIADTVLCNVSVSVTDADKVWSPPYSLADAMRLDHGPGQADMASLRIDSKYLELNGKATNKKGKILPVKELVGEFWIDSGRNSIVTIPLDSAGRFHMDNLYFYDTAHLGFQRNNNRWNTSDVRLTFHERQVPAYRLPDWLHADSVGAYQEDTSALFSEIPARYRGPSGFFAPKQLATIKIKLNKNQQWVKWRDELNEEYNPGGAIPPYIVDLVEHPDTTAINVLECLRDSIPGFSYSFLNPRPVPRLNGKRCMVFVDNENITYTNLLTFSLRSVAIIEVDNDYMGIVDPSLERMYYEEDTAEKTLYDAGNGVPPPHPGAPPPPPPTPKLIASKGPQLSGIPAILIFTRHPGDWKYLPTDLQEVAIPGFTRSQPFHPEGDKRWTLYWDPVRFNHFRVRFINNAFTKRFRLHIEGIDARGRIIDLDKVIQ